MHRSFESMKNWQRCQFLKIFVIPGGNTPPTISSWGDTSATLPNRNGRYQGTTCTSWLNFYTPCKSQPISLPYYYEMFKCCPSVHNVPNGQHRTPKIRNTMTCIDMISALENSSILFTSTWKVLIQKEFSAKHCLTAQKKSHLSQAFTTDEIINALKATNTGKVVCTCGTFQTC